MRGFYSILIIAGFVIFGIGCKNRRPAPPKEEGGQVCVWTHNVDAAPDIDWDNLHPHALVHLFLTRDFSRQADAVADEITRVNPDIAGLQEVTQVRIEQGPGAGGEAPRVVLDFLSMLQDRLADENLRYEEAGSVVNIDLSIPVVMESGETAVFRVIKRDVILAREGIPVSLVVAQNFGAAREATLAIKGKEETIALRRGFVVIDATVKHAAFQCACTHLETAGDEAVGAAQVQELIETLQALQAASRLPLILMGDFNGRTPPADPTGLVYQKVLSAGFCDNTPFGAPCFPPGGMGVSFPEGCGVNSIFTRCAADSQCIERLSAALGGKGPEDDIASGEAQPVASAWSTARFRFPVPRL